MQPGSLDKILIAAGAGAPMESLASAVVIAGLGIEGDRYASKRGYWSDPKWPDQELTLIEAEVASSLGVTAEQLRRNLVVSGVRLADLIGVEFRIGEALLKGVRPCDPCLYIEGFTRPGMAKLLADRGGLRAAIVEGGRISVGDRIEIEGGGVRNTAG